MVTALPPRGGLPAVQLVSIALLVSLLTLFYPTHFWTPHFASLWPEPRPWQIAVGTVVQALDLPIAIVSLPRIPYLTGLDLWFFELPPPSSTRAQLIVGHLVCGVSTYSALLFLPRFLQRRRLRKA